MATATATTQLTVSEAAEHVGVTRQTIFKKVKAGKLSATQNRRGHMQINVVELMRVFGELQSPQQVAQNRLNRAQQAAPATATGALQLELAQAKLELQLKEKELALAQERINELRERERKAVTDNERWFTFFERQGLLLTAPKATPRAAKPKAKTTPAPTPAKRPAARKTPTVAPAKPVAKKPAAAKKMPTRSKTVKH